MFGATLRHQHMKQHLQRRILRRMQCDSHGVDDATLALVQHGLGDARGGCFRREAREGSSRCHGVHARISRGWHRKP